MKNVQAFIDQYNPLAEQISEKTGVAPHVILGQLGLETGWGRSVIPGTNNLGNIKDFSGQGASAVDNQTGTTDKYKQFNSPDAFGEHFTGLLQRKYQPALNTGADATAYATALKQGGYAEDPQYVGKIEAASSKVLGIKLDRIGSQIVDALRSGHTPDEVAQALTSSPTIGGDVHDALLAGVSADKIIAKAGGVKYQEFLRLDPTYGISSIERGLAGAGKKLVELGAGAKEALHAAAGDETALAQDRAATAERNRLDAPLMATTAGGVGHGIAGAAPYLLAGALTGGAGIPLQVGTQMAAGAIDGAIKPTNQDGERTENMVHDAALAGGGALAGAGLGKLLSKFGASPGEAAQVEQRIGSAKAQGLPVNASAASGADGFARAITEANPSGGAVLKAQSLADDAMANKIAEGLGLQRYGGPVNHEMLNAARSGLRQSLDDATNVSLALPESLRGDLDTLVQSSTNPLTEGISTNPVVKQAVFNLSKAADAGTVVSGRELQGLASELKDLTRSQTASVSEKQLAGQIVGKINQTLTAAMTPEQAAAFNTANRQWANLKAAEKVVTASNDTGTILPRQILQAVKSGQFKNQFLKGEAPFQELGSVAADLYGPAGNKGLGALIAKGVGGSTSPIELAYGASHPVAGAALLAKAAAKHLMTKAATSQNPTLVRLMTGTTGIQKALADPTTRAYIAKALGATSGAMADQ